MSPAIAAFATIALVGCAGVALWAALFGRKTDIEDRITDMAVKMRVVYGAEGSTLSEDSLARSLFRWVIQRLPAPPPDSAEGEKLSETLVQAGFSHSGAPRRFHVVRISFTAGLAVFCLFISIVTGMAGHKAVVLMCLGAATGAFLPSYYIGRKARQRQAAIAAQLSDVLDLLVVCVEAGLGLSEAIKIVGNEADRQEQEIGAELMLVSGELAAGSSLGQALREFARRTAVEDIKPLAATLIQSEQLGASIGPALRSISDSLRNTRRLRAEEAAQKTTVKILFPLVLFILPAMMAVIVGPAMIQILHALSP